MDPIKKAAVELVAELVMSIDMGSDSASWVDRIERKMRGVESAREKRLQGIYKWLCPKATCDHVLKDHE